MSRVRRQLFDRLRAMGLPSGRLPYGSSEWWDKQYREMAGRQVEWGGLGYEELRRHGWCPEGDSYVEARIKGHLRESALSDADLAGQALASRGGSLLVLGGGTSRLSADMRADGWGEVLDIDFAPYAFRAHAEAVEVGGGGNGVQYAVQDATTMRPHTLPPPLLRAAPVDGGECIANAGLSVSGRHFDVAVDKGLVDGLWCSGPHEGVPAIPKVSLAVASVLRPGGRFLCLSYSAPNMLAPLLLGGDQATGIGPGSSIGGGDGGGLWRSSEVRKLSSLYLYVLERGDGRFKESPAPTQRTLVVADDAVSEGKATALASEEDRRKALDGRWRRKKGKR